MGDNQVHFIRPRDAVPPFEIPVYHHTRYEELIPDTLDIQGRAALAVNGLTGATDPGNDCLLYFYTNFYGNPPLMKHSPADICQFKFMEALPLMRLISGSSLNDQVDPVWMASALRMIGPDGLVYWPALPWAAKPVWGEISPPAAQVAVPAFVGRAISAMTVYMLRDPAGPWRAAIEGVVEALVELAIRRDDYAYFPQGAFVPGGPRPRATEMPLAIWSSLAGWTTQGLAQFYRATGYAPAGELAGRLARYIAFHGQYYGASGEFLPDYPFIDPQVYSHPAGVHPFDPGDYPGARYIHFQHHTVPLLGVLEYALSAGDRELADFVRQSFEWARAQGEPCTGYFPENIGVTEYEGAETCQLAGMIGLALKLSAAGLGDYWDDADRWIRNQFAENQIRRSDWMYRVHEGGLAYPRRRVPPSAVDPVSQTADHVPERSVGAFAGWPSANDLAPGQGDGIQQCCTGNGTRALYYIWENILTESHGELKLNLLLNRPSKWADVHSYIPFEGQVDVLVKQAHRLRVRIPEWVQPAEVTCRIDGAGRDIAWDGRYAVVGRVEAGQAVQLTFPIAERVQPVDIQKQRYRLTIKGNDVVHIDPPGRFCPLYQRDTYRENVVRWRRATRWVAEEEIPW